MSWLDDLPGQRLFADGAEIQPTARSWDIRGAAINYNHNTKRIEIDVARAGSDWKESVRINPPANVDLSSAGLDVVDGVALLEGDRVLLSSQTDPIENGIYLASAGGWYRSADAKTVGQLTAGATTHIDEGSRHGQRWYLITVGDVIPGTTPQSWTKDLVGNVFGPSSPGADRAIPAIDGTAAGFTLIDSPAGPFVDGAGVVKLTERIECHTDSDLSLVLSSATSAQLTAGGSCEILLDKTTNRATVTADEIKLGADVTIDAANGWLGTGGADARAALNVGGAMATKTRTIDASASPYSVAADDHRLAVRTTPGSVVIDLPDATNLTGRELVIKDSDGLANANGITLQAFGAQLIDGSPSVSIGVSYAAIKIASDGSGWGIE